MLQFYFLSILLNLLIGITLVYGNNEKVSILDDKTFQLVVGILSVFVLSLKFPLFPKPPIPLPILPKFETSRVEASINSFCVSFCILYTFQLKIQRL